LSKEDVIEVEGKVLKHCQMQCLKWNWRTATKFWPTYPVNSGWILSGFYQGIRLRLNYLLMIWPE